MLQVPMGRARGFFSRTGNSQEVRDLVVLVGAGDHRNFLLLSNVDLDQCSQNWYKERGCTQWVTPQVS